MPLPSATIPLDPATKHAMLLVVLYLSAAFGGTIAFAYGLRFARLGLALAVAAGAVLLAMTAIQEPILLPVALVGLVSTALAGRSILHERATR